jgi:hypothetical protein
MLKSTKAEPRDFQKWILECNFDKLKLEILEQMEKYLPSDETLGLYQELKENIEDLDQCEQYLVLISQIKGLRKRLSSFIFKCRFGDLVDEIRLVLAVGTQACIDVRNSEKFKNVLEILLLIGNFMNSGSNLEGTIGFDIKFLPNVSFF